MQTESCRVCLGTAKKICEIPGYQAPDFFEIYECSVCDARFSLPFSDPSAVYSAIYSDPSHPGYDRYWHYAQGVEQRRSPLPWLSRQERTYFVVANYLKHLPLTQKPRRILEIGSGLGYLTAALRKAGYEAWGFDLSDLAVKEAQRRFGDFYVSGSLDSAWSEPRLGFDLIIATELIEHVADPVNFLSMLRMKLDPTRPTSMLFTTPNRAFYPAEATWETSHPPVHYWWFTPESVRRLGAMVGGEVQILRSRRSALPSWESTSEFQSPYPHVIDERGVLMAQVLSPAPTTGRTPASEITENKASSASRLVTLLRDNWRRLGRIRPALGLVKRRLRAFSGEVVWRTHRHNETLGFAVHFAGQR